VLTTTGRAPGCCRIAPARAHAISSTAINATTTTITRCLTEPPRWNHPWRSSAPRTPAADGLRGRGIGPDTWTVGGARQRTADDDPDAPTDRRSIPGGRERLRDGVPFCLAVFIAARLLLSALGILGVGRVTQYEPPHEDLPAGWQAATPGFHNALDGTDRWDAGWYLRIAREGYGSYGSAAFYPGYPLATKGVWAIVGGDGLAAALLVSNAAFFGSLLVFHQLTREEFDPGTARRAVVAMAAFPTAFFFLAPYSESLFLLLTLIAFRQARRDRWGSSALAGAAAAFTRSIGIVLLPALIVEAVIRSREDGSRAWPRVVAACGVAVGPALYFAFWLARGEASAPLTAQGAFGRSPALPFVTLWRAITFTMSRLSEPIGVYRLVDLLVTVPVVIAVCVGWRRWRPACAVYVVVGLVFLLSNAITIRPLASVPRYCIVFFPMYWTFAGWLGDRARFTMATVGSLLLWCTLAVAFMNWVPVF
jgi:hypothetical protein